MGRVRGGDMDREHLICIDCGEHFDSDLFTEDPSETFVCPMCGAPVSLLAVS